MAEKKYLDETGLAHAWSKIKNYLCIDGTGRMKIPGGQFITVNTSVEFDDTSNNTHYVSFGGSMLGVNSVGTGRANPVTAVGLIVHHANSDGEVNTTNKSHYNLNATIICNGQFRHNANWEIETSWDEDFGSSAADKPAILIWNY